MPFDENTVRTRVKHQGRWITARWITARVTTRLHSYCGYTHDHHDNWLVHYHNLLQDSWYEHEGQIYYLWRNSAAIIKCDGYYMRCEKQGVTPEPGCSTVHPPL